MAMSLPCIGASSWTATRMTTSSASAATMPSASPRASAVV
jgi:hypothetical protein